jgi:hypothetical protein
MRTGSSTNPGSSRTARANANSARGIATLSRASFVGSSSSSISSLRGSSSIASSASSRDSSNFSMGAVVFFLLGMIASSFAYIPALFL